MDNKNTKNILLSCIVILAVSCLCLAILIISGVGVSLIWPLRFSGVSEIPDPTQDIQVTAIPSAESGTESSTDLPDVLSQSIIEIEAQVIQIRGLDLIDAVTKTLITPAELEEIVVNDFFSEYSEQDARQDVLILSVIGLLPEDFHLKAFYEELYSEQIAGFYDEETKEIYVVQGLEFGGSEKLTYAHEFTHVLQDQVYGLKDGLGLSDEACEDDSERCAAVQALIEGDASKTEILWFQTYATREDYADLFQTYENFESPVLDGAPPYMSADLYFPYEKGLAFVEHLFEQGGYEAVNEAYQQPPLSTEQILHPEKFPDDIPLGVSLPDLSELLGESWALIDQNVMGEWYTFLILNKAYDESHRLTDRIAEEAAAGWGGDAYAFYLNEDSEDVTFVLDTTWDTVADADEYSEAFEDYADRRWTRSGETLMGYPAWEGSEGTSILVLDGNRTLWITAVSSEIAVSILTELQ